MFSSGRTGAARMRQRQRTGRRTAWSGLFRPKVYRRGLALLAALELEAELLAFPQIAHPRPFDGRDVNENVLGAVVGLDETVALLRVTPLYCTLSHSSLPSTRPPALLR